MKSNNFKGKVAFVTGAASGIGRATAIAFALEGASVVVADISEQNLDSHIKFTIILFHLTFAIFRISSRYRRHLLSFISLPLSDISTPFTETFMLDRLVGSTVSMDISSLRQQAQLNLKTHINDKLPEEYQNCMVGINQVLKICWEIVNKSRNVDNDNGNGQTMTVLDNKTVLQALALINDCNKYKMDLTTNGVVITDAIKLFKLTRRR
jgi:hypothetical protein